jgi:hypothetical protein
MSTHVLFAILWTNIRPTSRDHTSSHVTHSTNPYLGIKFPDDLSWTTHIDNITKNASTTLGLRRNLRHAPKECKRNAYISLIRSTLEYGATIWDPYQRKEIDKLAKVQRQAARFISGNYRNREEGYHHQLAPRSRPPCTTTSQESIKTGISV